MSDVDEKSEGREGRSVTGRPVDVPGPNTTLADRAKARSGVKQVDKSEVEDKSVTAAGAAKKAPAKKKP